MTTTATPLEWLTDLFGTPTSDAELARLLALHTPESFAAFDGPMASFAEAPKSLPAFWAAADRQRAMG